MYLMIHIQYDNIDKKYQKIMTLITKQFVL